jgi:hypothetical protein
VQTLRQLLVPDPGGESGVIVRPAQIADWPTLGIRAVICSMAKTRCRFTKP